MPIFKSTHINEELKTLEPTKDFVLNNLTTHIQYSARFTSLLRNVAVSIKISIILLSTISTILLGLSIKHQNYIEWSRNIAFAIGAGVTFISSVFAAFNIERYWLKSKLMLYKLRELRLEYLFLQSRDSGITDDEIESIFWRHQEIKKMKYEYWEQIIKQHEKKGVDSPKMEGSKSSNPQP